MKLDIPIAIAKAIIHLRFKSQSHSLSPLKRTVKSFLIYFSRLELFARKFIPWRDIRLLLILITALTSVYWQYPSQPVSAREINGQIVQTQPSSAPQQDTKIPQNKTIKIGVIAFRGVDNAIKTWQPTVEYLTNEIPEYNFELVPLTYEQIRSPIQRGEVYFIITQPAMYVKFEALYGVNRIATLKTSRLGKAYTVFGGVIFRKARRNDIQRLSDFKGKTFMGVDETSFGGWLTAWREFKAASINPYRDFKQLRFTGIQDAVVYAVRDGLVDGGTVRTDTLESMAAEGKIGVA